MTTGVLEGFMKGDRCRYDDGSVRNLLQSTVAAVARDITLVTLRNLIKQPGHHNWTLITVGYSLTISLF